MRSISSKHSIDAVPARPGYTAYSIKLQDFDNYQDIYLSVIAPSELHQNEFNDLIDEVVLECTNTRLQLIFSEATPFDLMGNFEKAASSRGLKICPGDERLMKSQDTESMKWLH